MPKNLFVSGISETVEKRDLEDEFKKSGPVRTIDQKAGFAFIEFETDADADGTAGGPMRRAARASVVDCVLAAVLAAVCACVELARTGRPVGPAAQALRAISTSAPRESWRAVMPPRPRCAAPRRAAQLTAVSPVVSAVATARGCLVHPSVHPVVIYFIQF
jgi:hypothetical protein